MPLDAFPTFSTRTPCWESAPKTLPQLWGKDDSGANKSAMDWGAGWGTWVDTHTGDRNAANPSILGGVAAMAGGVAGGWTRQWRGETLVVTAPEGGGIVMYDEPV